MVNTPFTRHRQTSKLREYVTFELPALCLGDTLDAFLPKKPRITETLSGIEIGGVQYLAAADLSEKQKDGKTVQDVIVLGEVTIFRTSALNALLIPGFNRDTPHGGNSVSSVV